MTAIPIIVRRGLAKDIPTLVEFNVAMAHETEQKALDVATVQRGVQGMFDGRGTGFYLVAETEQLPDSRRVVGALMVTYEWSDWRNGWFWWIQSVYVHPEFRRRGVFRALFEFLKQEAEKQTDVCGMRLYVENENKVAQKTYETLQMTMTPYRMYELEFCRVGTD